MRNSLFAVRASVRCRIRNASVLSLACLLGLGPTTANGASTFANAQPTTQSGALGSAAGSNSMAANLSKLMSVLSMAAGGLFVAKGVQQLSCCNSGCTGNGAASKITKDNLDNEAKRRGSDITNRAPPQRALPIWRLRFGPSASNDFCAPARAFSLLSLFEPPQAQAAIGGCLDAMIALLTGGMMLLSGFMGMQAANQADQNANQMGNNMGNMNSYPASNHDASYPATPDRTTSSTGGLGSAQIVKMDPALLRTGTANDIMSQFEDKFGINRDKFANAVANGEDPRKLLGSAPRNALSNADMNKATNGAKDMSADDKNKANSLAAGALGNAQAELMAKLGTGAGKDEFAVNMSASGASSVGGKLKKATDDKEELESVAANTPEAMPLSPEVQAALANKEFEDRLNGLTSLSIFEVVHQKYREKSKIIFGYDPDTTVKGGANAKGN